MRLLHGPRRRQTAEIMGRPALGRGGQGTITIEDLGRRTGSIRCSKPFSTNKPANAGIVYPVI
jgi:hypothetical protein